MADDACLSRVNKLKKQLTPTQVEQTRNVQTPNKTPMVSSKEALTQVGLGLVFGFIRLVSGAVAWRCARSSRRSSMVPRTLFRPRLRTDMIEQRIYF